MGSLIAQNFDAKLHRAAWTKFAREGLESIPRVHTSYYNVNPSSNALEQEVLYSGLPTVPKVGSDTAKHPVVDFKISPQVVYRHDEYRMAYIYTKVAADDDQYGAVTDVIGTMGESAAYRIEEVAADVLNQGTTTTYTGWDGVSLFNAAHQLLDGSTYSNITTATGASQASAQAIINYFKRVKNDQGQFTPVPIKAIITSPELAPVWREVLGSSSPHNTLDYTSGTGGSTSYSETANQNPGVINVQGMGGLTPNMVIENVYLTGTADTYVLGQNHKLNMYMREAPNNFTYNENNPRAIVNVIGMRFATGFTDARRILRIPGA